MDGKGSPWRRVGLSASGLGRFLRAAQRAVGLEGDVYVLLADDATLRRLNRTFRGKDKATDVLSFPAAVTTVFFGQPKGPGLAGDLAISLEAAARQAAQFGQSLRDEVRVLLLHGVLHLAGFDHETDAGEMAARETELRRKLGLTAGLISRASGGANGKNRQKRNTEILSSAQDDGRKGAAQDDGRKGAAQDDGIPRNAGILRLRAPRSAQDDGRKGAAQDDGRKGAAQDVGIPRNAGILRLRAPRSAQDDGIKGKGTKRVARRRVRA